MPTAQSHDIVYAVHSNLNSARLLNIASELVGVPSPTRSAADVANRLAEILTELDFRVDRHDADWPEAPAIAVRLDSGKPGPTLQFDGHLDTVHLPYEPPRFEGGCLHGSGASDMKGGLAAATEVLLILRQLGAVKRGGVLFTAHEHHEGPWGDLRQIRALIQSGIHGDAVLIPEYLAHQLPVAGKGSVIFTIHITREGEPVHEIARPPDLPDVVAAGVALMNRLYALDAEIGAITSPISGRDSVFVGSLHTGEIYNQSPTECTIEGVRRWTRPGDTDYVLAQFRSILDEVSKQTGASVRAQLDVRGDAFTLDEQLPLVRSFQSAYSALCGQPLPTGDKPFVDDGNQFALFGIPAITHGPAGVGAHTLHESVELSELERVAQLYALTAITFCNEN